MPLQTYDEYRAGRKLVADGFAVFRWPELWAVLKWLDDKGITPDVSTANVVSLDLEVNVHMVLVRYVRVRNMNGLRHKGNPETYVRNDGMGVFHSPEFTALTVRLGVPNTNIRSIKVRFAEGETPWVTTEFTPCEPADAPYLGEWCGVLTVVPVDTTTGRNREYRTSAPVVIPDRECDSPLSVPAGG